jgi:RIO kinase 1
VPEPDHRHAPAWCTEVPTTDVELGHLTTGKEAEVVLVERLELDGPRAVLLADKRYRPMRVRKGDLEAGGFSKARTFTTDHRYQEGRRLASSRDERAVAAKTGYGRQVAARAWCRREAGVLARAHAAGVPVPYLVEAADDHLLMQLLGDAEGAAPRLVDARLAPGEVAAAHEQLREALALLLREGLVHADLSPYNALWWEGQVWLIDLPQAVDVGASTHALDLLHHDVATMATWCTRHGVAVDGDAWFAELLTELW